METNPDISRPEQQTNIMPTQLKNFLKYTIALAIGGFLFWLAVKDYNFPQMVTDVSKADFRWIFLSIIISLLSHVARAARWNLLLKPLGYTPKITNTFMAVMVGYFANIVIPRMGEVSRCVVLNKIENTHFNSTFGTVITERVFDLLCLLTLIGLSFLLEYKRFSDFFFNNMVPLLSKGNHLGSYIAAGLFFLLLIIVLLFKKRILNSPFYAKAKQFVLGLIQGVLSIRKMTNKEKVLFLLYTFLIWLGYYLMVYLVFFSLPYTSGLNPLAGLVILIAASVGMSAPLPAGGFGIFEILISLALTLFYGLTKDEGTTYALVVHASQFLTILVAGGICSLIVLFYKRKVSPVTQNI